MKSEHSLPVYALTKQHDTIASAIYTSAGVCSTEDFDNAEGNPQPRWVKALWDTGATHTSISDRLATELQLMFEDFVFVSTAVGTVRVPIYPIRLVLPNRLVFDELEAIQFAYSNDDDCDLIIGMDIMTQGDISMTNQEGRTIFSFRIPSLHTVDFESEHTV